MKALAPDGRIFPELRPFEKIYNLKIKNLTPDIEILRYAAATLELPGKSPSDGSILLVAGQTATHKFLVRSGTVVLNGNFTIREFLRSGWVDFCEIQSSIGDNGVMKIKMCA
ncbi:unnamed protein product [Macrosiphum euphorbiae]|uniref:Uncharacterized protein n=1 Tax=Macrosiphum euphorbiae TaxID=13131 RepID=A0AAV0Y689_9HEMI|nr:unnamed protein product [Macrosiphum euphorbiae]